MFDSRLLANTLLGGEVGVFDKLENTDHFTFSISKIQHVAPGVLNKCLQKYLDDNITANTH